MGRAVPVPCNPYRPAETVSMFARKLETNWEQIGILGTRANRWYRGGPGSRATSRTVPKTVDCTRS